MRDFAKAFEHLGNMDAEVDARLAAAKPRKMSSGEVFFPMNPAAAFAYDERDQYVAANRPRLEAEADAREKAQRIAAGLLHQIRPAPLTERGLREQSAEQGPQQVAEGDLGAAWKNSLAGKAAGDVVGKIEKGLQGDASPEVVTSLAMDTMMMGSAVPSAGLAANSARRAAKVADDLPMDAESVAKRMQEQGFTRDVYHGSGRGDITEFDLNMAGEGAGSPGQRALFVSNGPETANRYANSGHMDASGRNVDETGGVVYPLKAKIENPLVSDLDVYSARLFEKEIQRARELGHDAVEFPKVKSSMVDLDQVALLDPTKIRSRFAAFDPANADSANLLAANRSKLGGRAAALARALEEDDASRLARAAEQGFDTSRPVYHGTEKDFRRFDPNRAIGSQFWSTTDRAAVEAGEVGAQGRGVVKEMYQRIKNPAGWAEYEKHGIGELIARGFDGVALPDADGQITYIAFKPNQYRDVRAKFDPAKIDSADLMAVNPPGAGRLAAALQYQQDNEQ